ncbi:hypothetical protein C9374_012880 [Naegleria lovaniensis]|uniref:Uncharacterized protein n=1 Tax=Naegleria lovaniensis TaxID=51637 RepID=A0AA88GEB7_NAELO|nr:uncharacterized protein C9374_012880 [Naegleria lovaniensis]KAG2373034.1 hypothetical protein C9374_012880 [Naegleria lovaniensis]
MMSKFNPNSHRLMMNPAFFQSSNQQPPISSSTALRDIPVEIVESKRPSTASAVMKASSYQPQSTSLRNHQTRNFVSQQQQHQNVRSRMMVPAAQNAVDEDEENATEEEVPSSLYEMTRYLNKKHSNVDESVNEEENFVVQNTKLFKPVIKQRMNDFDETPIHVKYNNYLQEQEDVDQQHSYQDDDTPTSIHESPIKARPPPRSGAKHRRTLSSRILPNNNFNQRRDNDSSSDSASPPHLPSQSRQYRSPIAEEETEEQEASPIVYDKKPQRKQARYPKKLLEKATSEIVEDEEVQQDDSSENFVFSKKQHDSENEENDYQSQKQTLSRNRSAPSSSSLKEMKRLQEENVRLQGEINELKRDKNEMIKIHNDKIHGLTDRHNLDLQSQQQRMEKIMDEKDSKIEELQRENERLKSEIGLVDKSKDGQDTNKLLQELEQKRKSVQQFEHEKLMLHDEIERLKHLLSEATRQSKEMETKLRNKEDNLNGLSNKVETQEREIKSLKEKEMKVIEEREKAFAMFTESDRNNQQLQEKLRNLEHQSKQILRENESITQRHNTLDTIRIQLEKTNDQLRARVQTLEEEISRISHNQNMYNQEREQSIFNQQQQLQQELDMSRREIANLRETITILKNEKALLASQQQQPYASYNNFSNASSQPMNPIPPSRPHLSLDTFNTQPSSYDNSNYTPSNGAYNSSNLAPPSSYNRKNTNISYATTSNFTSNNFNSHVNTVPSYPTSKDYLQQGVPDTSSQAQTPANSTQKGYSSNTTKTTSNYTTGASNHKPSEVTPSSKSSQDTPFTLSMLNSKHESPKERQANRNKIMGTSYTLKPFAVDDAPKNQVAAEIDDKLMQLALEKTKLEGDMQKLLSMGIKSIASKKQKMSLESRLEEIEKETSQLKMRLRSGKF